MTSKVYKLKSNITWHLPGTAAILGTPQLGALGASVAGALQPRAGVALFVGELDDVEQGERVEEPRVAGPRAGSSGLSRGLGLSLDADNHRAEAAQEDEAAFDADTNGNIR